MVNTKSRHIGRVIEYINITITMSSEVKKHKTKIRSDCPFHTNKKQG